MTAAEIAHRAYWRSRGLRDAQIAEQWSCGCSEDAWEAVVQALAETAT